MMKSWFSVSAMAAVVSVLILSTIGIAEAGNMFTPPLAMDGLDNLECKLVNVGTGPITATITIFDASAGSMVGQPLTGTVNANRVLAKALTAPVFGDYFCKFTSASLASIRVAISRFQGTFGGDLNGYGNVK